METFCPLFVNVLVENGFVATWQQLQYLQTERDYLKLTCQALGSRKPKKLQKLIEELSPTFPASEAQLQSYIKESNSGGQGVFHRKLTEATSDCPFQWMSCPEPDAPMQNPEAPCLMEDILNIVLSDKAAFIEKCKVSSEQIAWLALRTVGQRSSQLWGEISKTSSDRKLFWRDIQAISNSTLE